MSDAQQRTPTHSGTCEDAMGYIEQLECQLEARDHKCNEVLVRDREKLECQLAEARQRIAELEAEYPNNRVACVSCHGPVDVTALNAIRCQRCGPTPEAEARLAEVVAALSGRCQCGHVQCQEREAALAKARKGV